MERLAAGTGGLMLWFDYHLRAATRDVEKGHNAAATRHLRLCQWVRPEQRDVLPRTGGDAGAARLAATALGLALLAGRVRRIGRR